MGKNRFFIGSSVFGQLISLIDRNMVRSKAREYKSDYYTKHFRTWDHLVTMLFVGFSNSCSLREVYSGMLALQGKNNHIGLSRVPARSTLSDANARRVPVVFESIYNELVKKYRSFLTDSSWKPAHNKKVIVIDATVITLFKEILKAAGRRTKTGQQKGGIKVHTLLDLQVPVPRIIFLSSASTNDNKTFEKMDFIKDNIYVFDKGYNNVEKFEYFIREGIFFVSRQRENATFNINEEKKVLPVNMERVKADQIIQVPIRENGAIIRYIVLRRILYFDPETGKELSFVTNLMELEDPQQIADLYKSRWKIELVFKQLKQNFPLKYFLGDNENAIAIQIWAALICNLLITVIKKQAKERKWAFSGIVSFCRLHLFGYINLIKFLNAPESKWREHVSPQFELELSG